jgi:hypothetical protein
MKLRNLLQYSLIIGLIGFAASCGEDDPILGGLDPDDTTTTPIPGISYDTLFMTRAGAAGNITISASPTLADTQVVIDVRNTTFDNSGSPVDIDRIYVTRQIGEGQEEPFTLPGYNAKGDGSTDVGNNVDTELTARIAFPIPDTDQGTVVYRIWATTGRGDFRDPSKRIAAGPGEITINLTGQTSSAAQLVRYDSIVFGAPLANGTSETFFSLFTGEKYKISEGAETAELWDFGYYYGNTGLASFASTFNYPTTVIDVPSISGEDADSLNRVKFKMTTIAPADFLATTDASAVDTMSFENVTTQRVNQLEVDDVVGFEDEYGNKGLMHIKSLVPGNGENGQITVNIRVQPSTNN